MNARTPNLALGILVLVAAAATSLALPATVSADEPVAAVTSSAADARAAERSAGEFLGLINNLRTSRGLPALQVHSGLAASAQGWAGHMASTGTLAHDPGLGSAVSGWTTIGENVGMGPTVSSIWAAFLASPQHLSNLTSGAYTHIGVGFVQSGGTIWTAHRFMAMGAAPPPPPPPPPVTAPPVTAPPATLPPAPIVTAPPPAASAPPATTPVVPVTTPPAPTDQGSDGSGGNDETSVAGDPSAEADRVAEVINALQALPG
jgi:uncharacterized protein YkwD